MPVHKGLTASASPVFLEPDGTKVCNVDNRQGAPAKLIETHPTSILDSARGAGRLLVLAMALLMLVTAPLLQACAPGPDQARPAAKAEATIPPGPEGDLLRSAAYGDIFRVNELLDDGADVNVRTTDGATALMGAIYYRFPRTAELLIARGADVNARSNRGVTALHQAAWEGYDKVVVMLLRKGADPNAKNNEGETPLMWAAMKGHDEVARLLIANGADVNAMTSNGATAASLARNAGQAEITTLLQQAGATR